MRVRGSTRFGSTLWHRAAYPPHSSSTAANAIPMSFPLPPEAASLGCFGALGGFVALAGFGALGGFAAFAGFAALGLVSFFSFFAGASLRLGAARLGALFCFGKLHASFCVPFRTGPDSRLPGGGSLPFSPAPAQPCGSKIHNTTIIRPMDGKCKGAQECEM